MDPLPFLQSDTTSAALQHNECHHFATGRRAVSNPCLTRDSACNPCPTQCSGAGHGILWDGYRNEDLERLIRDFYAADKTVATCSHGAVALLGVQV